MARPKIAGQGSENRVASLLRPRSATDAPPTFVSSSRLALQQRLHLRSGPFYATVIASREHVSSCLPVGIPRLRLKSAFGPRRRCPRRDVHRPIRSAPALARRVRALSCRRCSNDRRLFLHQNQGAQRPRCRAIRLCRPLGYGLTADLYQHPRAREYETCGCCL